MGSEHEPSPGAATEIAEPGPAESFAVEFPPELAVEETAPPAESSPSVPPASPKLPVPPTVPAADRTLFDHAEAARERYESDLRRRAAEAKPTPTPVDYNLLTDLNEVAAKLREEIRNESAGDVRQANADLLRTKVALSERFFKRDHADYDTMLQESGVAAAVALNPQTGQPVDPFLFNLIYQSDDPADTAYNYALGRLAKSREGKAKVEGASAGRQEVVAQVIKNAERPVGIASLPSSSGGRGITLTDIDQMSDEKKAWLKKNRPDVWRRYLGG